MHHFRRGAFRSIHLSTFQISLMYGRWNGQPVIGTASLGDLAPSRRKAEKSLGREVSATNYAASEYGERVAGGDHLLTLVLEGSVQFVQGERRALDKLPAVMDRDLADTSREAASADLRFASAYHAALLPRSPAL